ncbi:MarR family winged helix-turn-helix transcriptional regulator [Pseudonocardia sp. GCM10023141]|uniref:MarR family winged helix-turn-helix transcriptional regulator n=1 Tax=Pseudonocardia sp. GCM10023141 TaxID=3252653 RepID=UPI00360C81C5
MTHAHRLGDRVVWLSGRVASHAQRLVHERLATGEVRKQHYGVLASLADAGPAAQAVLADRIGIDRSDMVSLLDELEALELVSRRPDPADRRRNIVELTAAGVAGLAWMDEQIATADQELLAPLSAADRATLVRLLGQLLPASGRPLTRL